MLWCSNVRMNNQVFLLVCTIILILDKIFQQLRFWNEVTRQMKGPLRLPPLYCYTLVHYKKNSFTTCDRIIFNRTRILCNSVLSAQAEAGPRCLVLSGVFLCQFVSLSPSTPILKSYKITYLPIRVHTYIGRKMKVSKPLFLGPKRFQGGR